MLIIAITLIVIAYILYTISIFTERRKRKIEVWMVVVFGIALVCDLSGTTFMGLSSGKLEINLHSICGYFALIIMAIHFILSIIAVRNRGYAKVLFNKYSIYAWIAWSCAFFTGIPK